MSTEPQTGFRFRLVHPDGRQETMLVDAERALIGSAAHCEVRLPPEIAAPEHLEVLASGETIQLAVRDLALAAEPPLLDGQPTTGGYWARGAALSLGGVELHVELVNLGTAKAKPPVWLFAAILPVLGAVAAVVLANPARGAEPPIPEAPALLAPKGATPCPNVSAEQKPILAAERHRVGLAKRERSPFSPQDGLDAVTDFEVAMACWRDAGQAGPAGEAEHDADALRTKLSEDYRIRRVKLEHAYRIRDASAMRRELVVLIPMTSRRRGPYAEWLASLERAVTLDMQQRSRLAP